MTQETDALFHDFRKFMQFVRRYSWQEATRPHFQGQSRILKALVNEDNLPQSRIVELLDIRPSSVSEMLGKLEHKQLIERHPDEADGRVTRVSITKAGRKQLAADEDATEGLTDQIFASLTDEERTQLRQILAKLTEDLKSQLSDTEFMDQPDFHGHGPRHSHGPFGGFGNDRGGYDHRGHHPDHPMFMGW
ncbi:MarR family winged helix-turn-helix transcriptional regulator [Agrilactobacillus fermenti]|uniref:MarR family winged helix-turn-helix transcriptional regulator n=1 Tax=Agrilactobacillus fermenti TaxID=2586909 RepID=UPI001E3ED927|nr:MarR family transcriptional regulator [Agrilactobacillus fermenti]MCD2255603.1 MarR family transcriptional regulator [Agrilactobacillus fermenti]